jgi:hypothetical protein
LIAASGKSARKGATIASASILQPRDQAGDILPRQRPDLEIQHAWFGTMLTCTPPDILPTCRVV